MQRSVLLITLMMVSAIGFSQTTLKGPKAKNATVAEKVANASPLQFYERPQAEKGPDAKNAKAWESKSVKSKFVLFRRTEELPIPKGPKAKNKKVWDNPW